MATIQIENRQNSRNVDLSLIKRAAQKILSVSECPDAELSVLLVDDEEIRQINRDYLDRDRPTNVISFSMQEGEGGELCPGLLGDVVISVDTAARDAAEAEIPFEHELCFLLLHGILHLLGYDHERSGDDEAARMEARERELFALLKEECLQA
ncbi:MAG: rRNA maturation RNase YbeY [Deltaproteobacteria bacterium]|nr:MAG: rRNA maturation RNase YbeY [Deltaproteobacteria bacterium]